MAVFLPALPKHMEVGEQEALKDNFCKQRSVESDASTAASSVMHSPMGGPGFMGPVDSWGLDDLAASLANLRAPLEPVSVLDQVQRQIELVFSAGALRNNVLLKSKMDCFGWARLDDVLALYSLRQVKATPQEAVAALRTSSFVQVSGDFRRLRARDPTLWLGSKAWERPGVHVLPRQADEEDEDEEAEPVDEALTIATHIESVIFGQGFQHQEWISAEPEAFEFSGGIGDLEDEETFASTAWMRESDDAYMSAGSSLLQW